MSAHYVYRVYDDSDRLIYVGCTLNLFGRLKSHELNSWWAYQADRVVAKVYPDKASGRSAERDAIRLEKPRWNMFGRGGRSDWSEENYIDYVTAMLKCSDRMTPARQTRIDSVVRHYRNRYGYDLPLKESA